MNKKWWGAGLLVYVLALPLLFWRSSRIGKVLSVLFMCYVGFYALNRVADFGVQMYTKVVLLKQFNGARNQLNAISIQLNETKANLTALDASVRQRANKAAESTVLQWREQMQSTIQTLQTIEEATADLSTDERKRVKQRIVEIREQVKLLGGSLDSANVRNQIEEIIPGLALLRTDEKQRFLSDLASIGFMVDGVEKELVDTWTSTEKYIGTNGSLMTSGAIVTWGDSNK